MITFWIIAVLLLVAVLFFLLPPLLKKDAAGAKVDRDNLNVLLYKDQITELKADVESGVITQAEYEQAQKDLERRLLQDVSPDSGGSATVSSGDVLGKRTAAVLLVLMPLVTISIYIVHGAGEQGINPQNAPATIQAEGHDGNIDQQLVALKKHLKEKPDDAEGWLVLARTQYYVKNYKSAAEAFAQTVKLSNEEDAQLLADYADALAMASGRVLKGKPMELVGKALAIQPDHQKGLWLAATYAYQTKDYATTEKYWNQLLVQFAEGSEQYLQMLNNIGEARSLQGLSTEDITAKIASFQASSPASSAGSSSGPASVSGEVKLDPNLLANIAPTDTLFIFARAESGPRMPLAIIRTTASELPLKFTLDDSSAMRPNMKLSNFKRVVVGARISKSGNAMPQNGDLKGSTAAISVGSNNLSIVINDIVGDNQSAPPPTTVKTTSSNSAKVSGIVDIDAGLKDRVSPTDTLYIFARAATGPRMPLAIIKSQVSALPFKFSLDDSLAMNPEMKLSKFKDVIVTARISKSGNAMPQTGDLKGSTSVIKVGSEGLKIIIDSAVP